MNVTQLAVGGLDANFSYLLHDPKSGDAALVDPCGDTRVIKAAVTRLSKVTPRYILLTHGHHDHWSGVREVHGFFTAPVAAHPACQARHDLELADRQLLTFGGIFVECLYTPGHSPDSVVYRLGDNSALFTGDTLFVDWCGYCEPEAMFRTMRGVIYPLADSLEVYPGHDYGHAPHAPLGRQKIENPYLSITDYARFREALKEL